MRRYGWNNSSKIQLHRIYATGGVGAGDDVTEDDANIGEGDGDELVIAIAMERITSATKVGIFCYR